MNTEDITSEITYKTSRSSGPGGQHVNKVNTKVELRFDVKKSQALTDEEKDCILEKLSTRINQDGILIITAQRSRSQSKNKEIALEKFLELITDALTPEKPRIPVSPPAGLDKKRLAEKQRKSEKKKLRKPPELD
jgi:ribosome-associated protein